MGRGIADRGNPLIAAAPPTRPVGPPSPRRRGLRAVETAARPAPVREITASADSGPSARASSTARCTGSASPTGPAPPAGLAPGASPAGPAPGASPAGPAPGPSPVGRAIARPSRVSTSSAPVQISAPSRSRSWHPSLEARPSGPGTAMTDRSRARASATVDIDPPAEADSTTTTTWASAAMRRLRAGYLHGAEATPGGTSPRTAPLAATRRPSARLREGQGRSWPAPITATGTPGPSTAPAWAAASMPRARPDTTPTPAAARSRPRAVAIRRP